MKPPAPTYCLDESFRFKLRKFLNEFPDDGINCFSNEFKNIDSFVERALEDNRDRDDHELRRSRKDKYLLELVSFHNYDKYNRQAFNETDDTLIIMPHCLSLDYSDCLKEDTDYGEECRQCDHNCQASNIVDLAEKYGATVLFSKKKLSQQLEHFQENLNNPGVIGVACILMLAEGMRSAAKIGLPARGVLLKWTGCDHWNDEPFSSGVTIEWLEEILKEKYEPDN